MKESCDVFVKLVSDIAAAAPVTGLATKLKPVLDAAHTPEINKNPVIVMLLQLQIAKDMFTLLAPIVAGNPIMLAAPVDDPLLLSTM